ncbi:TraR/DksA family transcriptional regulator [Membranihabitans maritimus]|uniref:TraR/DksA family transcriptional regulator n=1 Tax=Membranihabitans maritimus TaxID=2904244 RepID=UPI001F382490|nr:hypothetical protein [Membranihabitans maritimus]
MAEDKQRTRYSDQELEDFRVIIQDRLEKARAQLQNIQDQIFETTENGGDEHGGDWVDDSGFNNDMELLNTMAIRQRKYIQDLENALVRIRNKTYGICVISGNLIPKERLRAVPTTTKSLMAKTEEQQKIAAKKKSRPSKLPYVKKERQVISKVVKKSSTDPSKSRKNLNISLDDDDDDDDDYFNDDLESPDMSSEEDFDD